MKNRTKVAAIALAAALSAGTLAGCGLTTTNYNKDFAQVIATVNITNSENFADSEYSVYADAIQTAEITKRDMVAYFVSTGYSMMQNYGWTYHDTFNMISSTLVNRQIYIQYAMLYLLRDAASDADPEVTIAGFNDAVAAAPAGEKDLAALAYFLTVEEEEKALYDTRVMFNNSIDSEELNNFIKDEDEDASTETARTTPTGIDTEDEEYYNTAYRVYTGANLTQCVGYEAQDGSTSTTRRKAYSSFLASLRSNDLIFADEDTSNIENLSYFKLELKNAYEAALINKLSDLFEERIRATVTQGVAQEVYDTVYAGQQAAFAADEEAFESALDGMSDTSFVLTAPEQYYGFVINILLPFSASASDALSAAKPDLGDPKGNHFVQRANQLRVLQATDQRGTWFTGAEDYSFVVADSEVSDAYQGGNADRKYLFFEDSVTENTQYERVPNYYGRYTYNGSVTKNADDEYVLTPNRITIDGFLEEMKGYLTAAAGSTGYTVPEGQYVASIGPDDRIAPESDGTAYFNRKAADYYTVDKTVDYSKFVYYAGKVDFGADGYDANEIFREGSAENTAFSVINELSFAYNTDTAGLNSYLGYAVSTGKTDYVPEFEYAAQYLCRQGAGSYAVVATDYGWHIMYCTFSFVEGTDGTIKPFTFDYAKREEEGTFSYLFYEAICEAFVSDYASNMQTEAINTYLDCATVYEERYADLTGLDTAS